MSQPKKQFFRREAWRIGCVAVLVALNVSACGSPDGFGGVNDTQREIAAARATTPLPPGSSFSTIKLDSHGMYQAGAGTNMIQFQAVCAWFGYWASAIADQNDDAEAKASEMAEEIKTWPTYVTSDTSLRSYWDSIIEQARLGDPSGLRDMIQNNCQ